MSVVASRYLEATVSDQGTLIIRLTCDRIDNSRRIDEIREALDVHMRPRDCCRIIIDFSAVTGVITAPGMGIFSSLQKKHTSILYPKRIIHCGHCADRYEVFIKYFIRFVFETAVDVKEAENWLSLDVSAMQMVKATYHDGVVIVRLLQQKYTDGTHMQKLCEDFRLLSGSSVHANVVVDMTGVTEMYTGGIFRLSDFAKDLKAKGRLLRVCNLAPESPHPLFQNPQIQKEFDIRGNLDQAFEGFNLR